VKLPSKCYDALDRLARAQRVTMPELLRRLLRDDVEPELDDK